MFSLMNTMNRDFDRLMPMWFNDDEFKAVPNVDIKDLKDHYEVKADLPSFNKEDIKVDFDGNILTISGKNDVKSDDHEDDGKFIRKERTTSSFERSFVLSNVESKEINADFKNGILTITLPKVKDVIEDSTNIEIN